ncbi:retrovirus-related pol polyprotein from transposon TNT 1-94 [Tanacetum coccineum]
MTGYRDKLINFVSKFIEGLGHNLFFVRQFCDSDLEVLFRKHTCFVRNLEGVDLLLGSGGSNLYTISMDKMMKSSPFRLLSKALKTKSCCGPIVSCQVVKSKKDSHPYKSEPGTNEKLQMLHMDLCRPMREASINEKRYILVIQAQVSLKAIVRYLRINNGIEFINQTLRNYTKNVGITHHTSTAHTPQQNGVVERHNRTLVETARTMLIFSKSLFFLWAEVVATACYTQNCSLIHPRYNKTPYELLIYHKPELKYLHVFGALCYPTNDFDDLGKLQPKTDIGIFIGYSLTKKAYQIYNKRTRLIMETMNVQFDELTQMAFEQHSSGPKLQGLTYGHISSGLVQNQSASTLAKTPTKND